MKALSRTETLTPNGHFYNEDGTFEGKVNNFANRGSINDVYTCTGKSKGKAKDGSEIDIYNEIILLKENNKNIPHSQFCYIAYIVKMEAGNIDLKELQCIAFASYNRSKSAKIGWKNLLATTYSSVPNKKELATTSNDAKSKLARKAVFNVLKGEEDLTKGAQLWDGTDFLAWGDSETNPYNKIGQNKFDEYKFIEIPKNIYETFLAANGTYTTYADKGNHDKKTDKGTHEHIKSKIQKPILNAKGKPTLQEVNIAKIKYNIPAQEFKNEANWTTGNFYYETKSSNNYGISATITAGQSIFWKITKARLTKF